MSPAELSEGKQWSPPYTFGITLQHTHARKVEEGSGSQKMVLVSGMAMDNVHLSFRTVSMYFFKNFCIKRGLRKSALMTTKICERDDYSITSPGSALKKHSSYVAAKAEQKL